MKHTPYGLIIDDEVCAKPLAQLLTKQHANGLQWYTPETLPGFRLPQPSPQEWVKTITADEKSRPAIIVVGANCILNTNGRRTDCFGLRIIERLRWQPDLIVPVLAYSFLSLSSLRHQFESQAKDKGDVGLSRLLRKRWTSDVGGGDVSDTPLYTQFCQVPIESTSLARQIEESVDSDPPSEKWRVELAVELLEAALERLCHDIRHQHAGKIAALRLLLGAYAEKDISKPVFRTALRDADIVTSEVNLERFNTLADQWLTATNRLNTLNDETKPHPHEQTPRKNGTILIIDDRLDAEEPAGEAARGPKGDLAWRPVHKALLNQSRDFNFELQTATSFGEALSFLTQGNLSELEFIILDVDLHDEPAQSGLHLLKTLRKIDPFVPVMTMTAFDDAEICQNAFQLKADAFFAKQLSDSADRSSLKYYRKFRQLVRDLVETGGCESEDRRLWRRFQPLRSRIRANDVASPCIEPYGDGVLAELTKVFMLLRMTKRHYLVESLLLENESKACGDTASSARQKSYDELMIILLNGLTVWGNWNRSAADERLTALGDWLEELDGMRRRRQLKQLGRSKHNYARHMSRQWGSIRHVDLRAVPLKHVRRRAMRFLELLEAEVGSEQLDLSSPKVELNQDLASCVSRARVREQTRQSEELTHSQRSKMGSEAVLLGAYCSENRVAGEKGITLYKDRDYSTVFSARDIIEAVEQACEEAGVSIERRAMMAQEPLHIAYVDDHGAENGWAYVTQLVHNNAYVSNLVFKGCPKGQDFDQYVQQLIEPARFDFVFLDLRMPKNLGESPSNETGIDVAAAIRKIDPLVPIVIISAQYHSMLMREAVRKGATYFFPKQDVAAEPDELIEYYNAFRDVVHDAGLYDADWRVRLRLWRSVVADLRETLERAKQSEGTSASAALPRSVFQDAVLHGLIAADPRETVSKEVVQYRLAALLGPQRNGQQATQTWLTQALAHIEWLFRRAVFFALLKRTSYLAQWVAYFSDPQQGIDPDVLTYKQTCLACGTIVEFAFRIVLVSNGKRHPQDHTTPGDLSNEERTFLADRLGLDAYTCGRAVWDLRNDVHHHTYGADADDEWRAGVTAIRQCIEFLQKLGLVANDDPLIRQGDNVQRFVHDLRVNLQEGATVYQRRTALNGQMQQTERDIRDKRNEHEKYAVAYADGRRQNMRLALERLEGEIRRLEEDGEGIAQELSGLSGESVLRARRELCGGERGLWPSNDDAESER